MTLGEKALLCMEPGREYETRELYAMVEREADGLLRELPDARNGRPEDMAGLLPAKDREWVRTVKSGSWRVMIDAMKQTREAGFTSVRFIDAKPLVRTGGKRTRKESRVWLHRLREY